MTDVRGCREAVVNGLNGLVVPLGEVDALAEAIVKLLTDEETAQRMGVVGRDLAQQRYDQRIVFQNVADEYDRLFAEAERDREID